MRLSGVAKEVPSLKAVTPVPPFVAIRNARTLLATNSSGVFTFCACAVWLRKRSELKMTFRTARMLPFGVLFSQASIH